MIYFVVDMPLNADGDGPEMDPNKVVEVRWQVWDESFQCVAEYATEEEAVFRASELSGWDFIT